MRKKQDHMEEEMDGWLDMYFMYVDAAAAKKAAARKYTVIAGPGWYWSHDGWTEGPFATKKEAAADRREA